MILAKESSSVSVSKSSIILMHLILINWRHCYALIKIANSKICDFEGWRKEMKVEILCSTKGVVSCWRQHFSSWDLLLSQHFGSSRFFKWPSLALALIAVNDTRRGFNSGRETLFENHFWFNQTAICLHYIDINMNFLPIAKANLQMRFAPNKNFSKI